MHNVKGSIADQAEFNGLEGAKKLNLIKPINLHSIPNAQISFEFIVEICAVDQLDHDMSLSQDMQNRDTHDKRTTAPSSEMIQEVLIIHFS